jgi:acyl transferase domain-containing protein/D-arabinose 1-dehydrogenase-like Zn-dependent alcohol dehydrogenase
MRIRPADGPRRAAVSSFGIGGTNAHVVLEEAPASSGGARGRPLQLLPVSAPSSDGLVQSRAALAARLGEASAPTVADAAFTLQAGRRAFAWRTAVVAAEASEAVALMREQATEAVAAPRDAPPVIFMFSGQGSQYPGMADDLYGHEPIFRERLDYCSALLRPRLGIDLREAIFDGRPDAGDTLQHTALAQPALFAIGYSLACLWQHWGVRPAAVIGHSLGEYVAACVAGVLDLDAALAIVARRGELMEATPPGAMLAVSLGEGALKSFLFDGIELAAVNAPDRCVVGGAAADVQRFAHALDERGIDSQLLRTAHAFHTAAMDSAVARLAPELARIRLQPPDIPLVSNLTGEWIAPRQATDPGYYSQQARRPVRFADGIACILRRHHNAVLLEVGPGRALVQSARRCAPTAAQCLASLPSLHGGTPHRVMLTSLGVLWTHGVTPDWSKFSEPGRQRVALPFTPLQRERHWIEPPPLMQTAAPPAAAAGVEEAWCYRPAWHRSAAPVPARPRGHWVLLTRGDEEHPVGARLRASGCEVTPIRFGAELAGPLPDERSEIVVVASHGSCPGWQAEDWVHGLTALFQSLDGKPPPTAATIVASGIAAVAPGEAARLDAEKGTLPGFMRAAAAEFPDIPVRLVDFPADSLEDDLALDQLLSRCQSADAELFTAWRPGGWWRAGLERLPAPALSALPLRVGGTYLITGGLGGIGLTVAEHLARVWRARLVLLGRSPIPPEETWQQRVVDGVGPPALLEALARLQVLRSDGAAIIAETADLSDESQTGAAIKRARERFGPLHGVIHAAGVADGGLIASQRREAIDAVLAPKITGTRRLAALLKEERLDFLVLCSALSAAVGAPGQAAYCAANSYLDHFATSGAAPWPVVSIAWDEWRDIGMAARARQSEARRHSFDHPLIEACRAEADGRLIFQARLDPVRDWVLGEHRIGDEAIFPGTAYLELAYAAGCHALGRTAIALEDVQFLQPLRLRPDEVACVEITISPLAERREFVITSRVGDGPQRVHAEGYIAAIDPTAEQFLSDGAATQSPGEALKRSLARFGPRWQCLERLGGPARDHAELALPARFMGTDAGYRLHPALLDVATGFAVLDRQDRHDLLPSGYRRIRFYDRIPPRLKSRVTRYRADSDGLHLDLTLARTDGQTVVSIEDYEFRRSAQLRADADNFRLALAKPGQFDSLGVEPCGRKMPESEELEIEVFAAGLNFKEVLFAAGLLPEAEVSGLRFGLECAGRITRTGSRDGAYRPGDAVIAYGSGCLQRFATVPAAQVLRLPDGLTFAEAAGLPTAFVTAYYALVRQARLQAGETVLIHAAAGGVGLAAVHIAQGLGARVLCTAGSPEKRAYLRQLGVAGVFGSRNADFVGEIRQSTDGRGVDVVLNSLSADLMRAGLACLSAYGRFLDLTVRDIHGGEGLDLGYFAKAISFHAISVGPGMPGFADLFREVVDKLAAGEFAPLPHKLFPLAAACDAFAYMAKAEHIGKVIVGVRADAETRPEPRTNTSGLSPAEGLALFRHSLASGQAHVIVSKRDPAALTARRRATTHGPDKARGEGAARPLLPIPLVAPVGSVETGIAAIWRRVLGLAEIGVHDDFFALGGDSLIGVQLIAEVNRELGGRLSLRQLLVQPTVAGLAACLADALAPAAAAIPPAPVQRDYPLSHAQRRMWILARDRSASIAYNMSYRLSLAGALDVSALRRGLGYVVARHESLRTAFVLIKGVPRAEIRLPADFDLPILDLCGQPDHQAAAAEEIERDARRPFALDDPPLLRACLLRLARERHELVLTVHHIVADGLSLNVLMQELHEAYTAYASGRTPSLPALPVQAKDIAVWDQSRLADDAMRHDREFWLQKLGGDLATLDLPTNQPRSAERQFGGGVVVLRSPAGHAALHRFCREQGVSPFTMLVAVVKVVLHQLTGAEEILLGTPVAGRDRPELEGQIGHYLNLVVLRDTVRRIDTFAALLKRVHATVTEALAHQSYPFDLLVEELAVERSPGRQPLFDVQINLMPAQTPTIRLGDLAAEGSATDNGTTIFDLNLMFSDGAEALVLEIAYAASLFDPAAVTDWGKAIFAVLAAAAKEPARSVRSLCAKIEGGAALDERADFLAAALQLDDEF